MIDHDQKTVRTAVEALDSLLGVKLPVLDDGFVRVVDYMGSDESVVQAARVSYGRGTKKVHEDRGLIRYLMRHQHTTPFEMCELKLHVRVPMDCWRQWIRHRTASVNEYSTRYSVAIDATQQTSGEQWRAQSGINRQGSGDFLSAATGAELSAGERDFHKSARALYEHRLSEGVAREQARKDLPLSTYTEAYWKVDLHNLLRFLELRMHNHAQFEIRQYATLIAEKILSAWCPLTWEAFQDYRLDTILFSKREKEALALIVSGNTALALEAARAAGWIGAPDDPSKRNRERDEFERKLEMLGVRVPWIHQLPSEQS
jgi:thymidylate synthase (FAD)